MVEAPPAFVALDPDAQCLSCGAAFEPGQEYCLECGARIRRPAGTVPTLGRAWRRPLGWYPGDWIWGSLVALVVAAGGAPAAAPAEGRARPVAAEVRLHRRALVAPRRRRSRGGAVEGARGGAVRAAA